MFFRRRGEVWGFLALSRTTGLKGAAGRSEPSTATRAEAPGHGRVQGYALAVRAARQARCGGAEVVRRPWVATGVDVLCVYGPGTVVCGAFRAGLRVCVAVPV